MIRHNRGQMIMINLLFLLMTIAVLIAIIPALSDILSVAQQSDSLNCNGYVYGGDSGHALSYNASLQTNSLACLAINMYLPYIVLAVLIMAVSGLLVGGMSRPTF